MLPLALSIRIAAAIRRLKRLAGVKEPPPPRPAADRASYDPSFRSAGLIAAAPRALSRSKNAELPVQDWQEQARAKLVEISGYPAQRPTPSAVHDTPYSAPDGRLMREVVLAADGGFALPLMIAEPDQASTDPKPVMICLQGTNSGFHLSWGETREPIDAMRIANGGDFLRQACAQGYLSIALEMRGFGRREERVLPGRSAIPVDHAMHLMLTGRSLLGERAGDISLLVDWLTSESESLGIDPNMIYVMGQSAGGSVALYTLALDPRVAGGIASGSVGYAAETFGARGDRAGQNVIPGFLNWMENDDVLSLCAPRPVLVMSGTKDHIYPADGAKRVCDAASKAWSDLDAPEGLRHEGPEGPHRFYPGVAWPAFQELTGLPKQEQ